MAVAEKSKLKGHEYLDSSETAIRNHVKDGACTPETQREGYRAACKREEGNKEGDCMEEGYSGSKYRWKKCSFGIVPLQAMRTGQRKVCRWCLEPADV